MRRNRLYLQQENTNKITDPTPHSLGSPPPHSIILGTPVVFPVLKMKSRASASVCRVTLYVYCWVHFVTIAKMYGITCSVVVRIKSQSWTWIGSIHGMDWIGSYNYDPVFFNIISILTDNC